MCFRLFLWGIANFQRRDDLEEFWLYSRVPFSPTRSFGSGSSPHTSRTTRSTCLFSWYSTLETCTGSFLHPRSELHACALFQPPPFTTPFGCSQPTETYRIDTRANLYVYYYRHRECAFQQVRVTQSPTYGMVTMNLLYLKIFPFFLLPCPKSFFSEFLLNSTFFSLKYVSRSTIRKSFVGRFRWNSLSSVSRQSGARDLLLRIRTWRRQKLLN